MAATTALKPTAIPSPLVFFPTGPSKNIRVTRGKVNDQLFQTTDPIP